MMISNNRVKSLFTIMAAFTLTTNIAIAAPIFCPPSSAIHCSGDGNCDMDEIYSDNWRGMTVSGTPKQPNFAEVVIYGAVACTYGSSKESMVYIYGKQSFVPDTSSKNNWQKGKIWRCASHSNAVEDCPMNAETKA